MSPFICEIVIELSVIHCCCYLVSGDDREGFVQKVKNFMGFRNQNEDLSRLTWEVTGDDQEKQSFTRITKWVF